MKDERFDLRTDLKNLNMTEDELRVHAWCCENLESEQIADIQDEAFAIAQREVNAQIAGEKLLEVLVRALIRSAEEQQTAEGSGKSKQSSNGESNSEEDVDSLPDESGEGAQQPETEPQGNTETRL